MQLVTLDEPISVKQLQSMSTNMFGALVKAVVDLEKQVMIVDAQLHADQENELIKTGSKQVNLWGINLYPDRFKAKDFIEFDSMINLRPQQNNSSRSVENSKLRQAITQLVDQLVI